MDALQALTQQRLLLQLEYSTEKEAFRRQTEESGIERKVRRGDAWWPLRLGRSYYNSMNQLALEVVREADTDVEHNFEFGRPVVFFAMASAPHAKTATLSYLPFTATVSYVDGDRMVVILPDSGRLLDLQRREEPLGVQLSFDETSYRCMFDALDRTMRAKGRLAYLRDLFFSRQRPATLTFQNMRFPYLNSTQERAVNEVLRAKDVAIVHGPPGTGKTTTLVEAIRETLMRESQVLVCAQSNMAVDWISEKLVDRGINVLRIGNPTRVNDKMLSFTYERRFEAHPDYPQLWAIRKAIRELRSHRKRGDENYHQKMDRLKSRATELEIRINGDLFGEARVIACTLVGSANRLLDGHEVRHAVHRRGRPGPGGCLLDSHAPRGPRGAGRRPLSAAAHGEEHCRPEGRTGQDAHGAHRGEPPRGRHAAEDAVPHERRHHALLQQLLLRRKGGERSRGEVPQHPRPDVPMEWIDTCRDKRRAGEASWASRLAASTRQRPSRHSTRCSSTSSASASNGCSTSASTWASSRPTVHRCSCCDDC